MTMMMEMPITRDRLSQKMFAELLEEVRSKSLAERAAYFRMGLTATARGILMMAAAVHACDLDGQDIVSVVPECRTQIDQLRLIANGQLLPELLVKLRARPALLKKAAALPVGDQQKLAADEPIEVFESTPAGPETRQIPFFQQSPRQQEAVLAHGHLRTPAEQRTYLQERRQPAESSRSARALAEVRIRVKDKCIEVLSPGYISLKSLLRYVEDLRG